MAAQNGNGTIGMAAQGSGKNNFGFALFLSLALILLMVPGAHAASCGTVHAGSGTCSSFGTSGTHTVPCASMGSPDCCGAVSNCEWTEAVPGRDDTFACRSTPGAHAVTCSGYDGNEIGCKEMGCKWTPAGSGACSGSSSGAGYGSHCTSNAQCATCLVCDTTCTPPVNKCTQRPGVCTTVPAIYVPPPPQPDGQPGVVTPQSSIEALESGAGVVSGSSKIYKVGWFSDWKASGLIGVAIVCSIIALAAMMGKAFNLPEIKAFANNEIKQAVISVLLIVSLVALVTFFNEIAVQSIRASDLPVNCNVPEPCYVAAAKAYITTVSDIGKTYAQDNMRESIDKMRRSTYGYNINANIIYLAYAGFSIRFNAGDSLVAERHGALFSQASKILASLSAQKYFLDVVTFGIAPLFILLGIVLRTFFFTRKLGGLLLAIAISLFIIYPLTYAFAWYTLNVTVYGERTLAVADPSCPNECTATYPAAFFTSPSTGQLVQFPTTQAIVRAGITKANWGAGGPAGAFPGLVACKDLSAIGLPDSGASANACPKCPDYCRDVPFPSSMPGCDIVACSACNPGCKIVRQRLNCNTDPSCPAGACPDICRTRVPTENKCFNDEKGGVIPANLSVSCAGCGKYPAWCRFLREEPVGTFTPMYPYTVLPNGEKLNAACKDLETDLSCPKECSYITRLGSKATCDDICSVKDASTGETTSCPSECRVDKALGDPEWMSTYDIIPPDFGSLCTKTPAIAAACAVCKTHEECLVAIPADPTPPESAASCAAYPTRNAAPEKCLACPDYCRRTGFSGVFIAASQVERGADGLPRVCDKSVNPGIDCSSTGTPPACASECRVSANPPICRPYDPAHTTDGDVAFCRGCPDEARYLVRYIKQGPPGDLDCASTISPIGNSAAPAGGYAAILSGATSGKQMAAGLGQGASGGTIRLAQGTDPNPQSNPYMNSVSLLPDPADGTIALLGHCKGTDTGGLPLKYEFAYYLGGVGTPPQISGQTADFTPSGQEVALPLDVLPSMLSSGQDWSVSCRAYNGAAYSAWVNSGNVTITAPPPTVTVSSRISPVSPLPTDTLSGWCKATDSSAPYVVYYYSWYKNGALHSSGGPSNAYPQGVEEIIATISPPLSSGDAWTFSCRADGYASSDWLDSAPAVVSLSPPEAPCTTTQAPILLATSPVDYHCSAAGATPDCPGTCQKQNPAYAELPNENSNPLCQDSSQSGCPYGCRIKGAAPGSFASFLDPSCAEKCASLPDACKIGGAAPSPPVPICSEYIGNGPAACHSMGCISLDSQSCTSVAGCAWNTQGGFCDSASCAAAPEASCTGECAWMRTGDYAKISARGGAYGNSDSCRQCPEQCRLDGYTGDCGVKGNGNNEYVDCSETACPASCRVAEPLAATAPPAFASCLPYPDAGVSCTGCPALCRRSSDLVSNVNCPVDSCALSSDPQAGCMDECRLPDPPARPCEGCFECNMDCTYYPAIRTDCGDICSDAALAGPVDISPTDFVKKLSGAKTSADGEWARSIGMLFIPAVVLPLFCIVIVIAFVRIFSPILGGDIEIPGLGRII